MFLLSFNLQSFSQTILRFECADIIYDMSKDRHLYKSVSLKTFYLIRQPALWIISPLSGGSLCKVWAAPFYY